MDSTFYRAVGVNLNSQLHCALRRIIKAIECYDLQSRLSYHSVKGKKDISICLLW